MKVYTMQYLDPSVLMAMFSSPQFWLALGSIIMIDILLGGDNALVIGNAVQRVPIELQKKAMFIGLAGAVVLRIVFLILAAYLLQIPGLFLLGSILLLKIGVDMALAGDGEGHHIQQKSTLWSAVGTVLVADAIMSLDNVVAVAGTAHGTGEHSTFLMIAGVILSIPIMFGLSKIVIAAVNKFPVINLLGGLWLIYTAAGMIVHEDFTKLAQFLIENKSYIVPVIMSILGTYVVVQYYDVVGKTKKVVSNIFGK